MDSKPDLLELAGAALVILGVGLFALPAALILAGVALVLTAYSLSPTSR